MGKGKHQTSSKDWISEGSRRPFLRPSGPNGMGFSIMGSTENRPQLYADHTNTQPPNHRTTEPLSQPHTNARSRRSYLHLPSHGVPKARWTLANSGAGRSHPRSAMDVRLRIPGSVRSLASRVAFGGEKFLKQSHTRTVVFTLMFGFASLFGRAKRRFGDPHCRGMVCSPGN